MADQQDAPYPQPGDRVPGTLAQTYGQQAVPTGSAPPPPAQQDPQQAQPQPAPQQDQPQQGVPTTVVQSGPTAKADRPFIDPRPYASLAEHAPQYKALVDKVAEETGTSPQRLAWHWYKEGGFRTQVEDGKAGEQGPMQVMRPTADRFDKDGKLNLRTIEGGLTAAGRYINALDSRYGQDTPSSVGAYQGGEGSADDIAANPAAAAQKHPRTLAYAASAFPGQQVSPASYTGGMQMDPKQLVDSVQHGGPEGFLNLVAQTAQQSGTTMSDAMRSAEATLVGFAAARGDYAGMQHARDFVLQVSHAGANQYLMGAHQALQNGDGQAAAQYLARAHAFFPDGTMGQFGVDSKGQVWGARMDEHQPGRMIGQPFKVDANGVAGMLQQTADPGKYLQMVQAERQSAAQARLTNAHGDYYGQLLSSRETIANANNQSRETIAAGHDDTHLDTAQTRADAQRYAADTRAASRQGAGPSAQLSRQVDKETATEFNELSMPGVDEDTRGKMAETYHDIRMNGTSPPQSLAIAKGLHNNRLGLKQMSDGSYGVVDPKDKTAQPIAILSASLGNRLAGGAGVNRQPGPSGAPGANPGGAVGGGASPVGAGAGTATAQASGVSSNLSGTVSPQQSSALPVGR